jgi:hydrogenase/urease accessory protein HupE
MFVSSLLSFLRGMISRSCCARFVLLFCFCLPDFVFAHDPGLSSATVKLLPDRLEIEMVLSLADASQIMDSYHISNGQNPTNETPAITAEFQKVVPEALEVRVGSQLVKAREARAELDLENRNANIILKYDGDTKRIWIIRSKWLSLLPPAHRQFLTIQRADGVVLDERLLSTSHDTVTIQLASSPDQYAAAAHNKFADFLLMGVRHIWTGYDHLLFLFGLLIVTRSFGGSIKIITCFTIAHSITLAVSTLSLIQISSRIVEPLIAVSIVYVGIENLLRGDDPKGRWILTFAFGLIHGFGFASVLRDHGVGAGGSGIAIPLVSFNIGVEIGQIVVAGLLLPVIWKLRGNPVFVRRWVPAGSIIVALLGSYWFIQRIFI